MSRFVLSAFGLCLLALAGCVGTGDAASGEVRVVDGDTLVLAGERIRLHGIDAPETEQDCTTSTGLLMACGAAATQALRGLVDGQRLTCERLDTDRYGRTIGRCSLADGRDVGQVMVAMGYAVAYTDYSDAYVADETEARRMARGLWTTDMEPPALYRASQYAAREDIVLSAGACRIKGNISDNGRIYHVPGEEWYERTRIDESRGERWFCSSSEAEAAGWRAARR